MKKVKICVVGDTHGNTKSLKELIDNQKEIHTIIHLGDNDSDVNFLKNLKDVNIISVKGNCDFNSKGKSEGMISITDKNIFFTHGHKYDVKFGYQKLYYRALELGADVVLFGHTHRAAMFWEGGIFFLNPGSIYRPKSSLGKTFAILTLNGNIEGKIVKFE